MMRWFSRSRARDVSLRLALVALPFAACDAGSDDGACAGSEGCVCYPNATCNASLRCIEDTCVDLESAKPGTGGDAGAGRGQSPSAPAGGGGSSGAAAAGGTRPSSGGNGGDVEAGAPAAGSTDPGSAGAKAGGAGGSHGEPPAASDGGEPAASGGAGGTGAGLGGGAAGDGGDGGDGGDAAGGGKPPVERGPGAPTVLVLLDGSSSMFMPRVALWDAALEALVGDGNPIQEFDDRVRFGFTHFRGASLPHAEDDPACATLHSVDFRFDNFGEIRELYQSLGADYTVEMKWETPTGFALDRSIEALLADEHTSGRQYIVLITDGDPNTCSVLDPQCGQDQSIAAVQRAYAAGIRTYAIGIGDIARDANTGCFSEVTRCGTEHLQDLANAGRGLPVQLPPDSARFQDCLESQDFELRASYAAEGGPLEAMAANDAGEVRTYFRAVLEQILDDSKQ